MSTELRLESISETMQMYIKAIHDIQRAKGAARVTDIAARLGVRKGSVSVALKGLSERELVNYAPYDVTTLTEAGTRIAEQLDQRYDVLRGFFEEVLGLDASQADREACDLEHRVSELLLDRLVGFADYYEHCTASKFRWNPSLGGFCVDPEDADQE